MATTIPVSKARFSVEEMAQITGGEFSGVDGGVQITGLSSDSRRVPSGGAFVALAGDRFDGHQFVAQARERGAAIAIVERGRHEPQPDRGLPLLSVGDSTVALGDLASAHRIRWGGTVVAITGSVGKTTTKELTAAALKVVAPKAVAKTQGNLNNRIGVPHTLLTLSAAESHAVIEAGTSLPGEIPLLGAMIAPDVAVVTAVRRTHATGFPDLEDLADEKAALFHAVGDAGVLVANRDDPKVWERAQGVGRRVVSFGTSKEADVCLVQRAVDASLRQGIELSVRGKTGRMNLNARLSLLGEGAALSAAMAVAVVVALESHPDMELLQGAVRELEQVVAPSGRLEVVPGSFGGWILDDSYNASPSSMRHALLTAVEAAEQQGGRVFAALGDMLDLAAEARAEHRDLARETLSLPIEHVVVLGDAMREGFSASGSRVTLADDAAAATSVLRTLLRPGDVLLVKGSRGMNMERIAHAFAAAPDSAASVGSNSASSGGSQ